MSTKLRAECRQRAEVGLANVRAAQQSTTKMRKPSSVVVHLLDTAQSALRSALAELAEETEPA